MAKRSGQPKRKGPGRPAVHGEPYTKTTITLLRRQMAYLDRLAVDIREKTGAVLNRAEFIRAMIDAVEGAGLDLTGAQSEADLREVFAHRLRSR